MWVWVDRFGGTALDVGLAAAVLLGLTALAMVGCRQPARRCSLARAAFLASLALWPLVLLGRDRPRIDIRRPIRTVLAPLVGPWPAAVARPAATPAAARPAAVALAPVRSSASTPVSAASAWPVRAEAIWIPRAAVLGYLAVGALAAAWLALGWACSYWIGLGALEPSAETRAFYESLPFAGWGWRRPRLRLSTRVGRPVLLGVLRPMILVPPDFDRPTADARERLRLGLLHELAHAERGDAWFTVAGSLVQAAWFFLPWVWWMRRQMRLDQEFLADHSASHGFGPFGSYASSLVDLADTTARRQAAAAPAPAPAPAPTPTPAPAPAPVRSRPLWGAGSALFQRVLMLVRCPYPVETRTPRWWRWSLPPLVASFTLLASSLTLRSAETRASADVPPHIAGPGSPAHLFQLARLVIAEGPAGDDGFTRPHDLPLALPAEFDLVLDVWAEPADLPRTRVVGHRLGIPGTGTADGRNEKRPCWHTVEVHRDCCALTVRLDGQPVPPDTGQAPLPAWLSIQPAPGKLGLYRNIRVTW